VILVVAELAKKYVDAGIFATTVHVPADDPAVIIDPEIVHDPEVTEYVAVPCAPVIERAAD
jgi:hypothetical protein